MNDFTKEELEDIYEAVMDTDIAMFLHLPKKIQSLIENYCDHDINEKLNTSHAGIENFRCNNCQCQFINEPITYKKSIVGEE